MLGITKIAFALVALTASPGKDQDTHTTCRAVLAGFYSGQEEVRSNMPRARPPLCVHRCANSLSHVANGLWQLGVLPSLLPVEDAQCACFSLFRSLGFPA